MQNVSWKDYEGVSGFGAGPQYTQGDIENLNKALYVGNAQNNPGASPGEGFPLRIENLERTLKNVSFRMEHLRLYKAIPKVAAYNTVEEWNELSSYGDLTDGFVAEGQLPEVNDSTYERKYAVVKFLGTTRVISHIATMIKPAHGSVVANETVAGTMDLLRMLERALFKGDSSLSGLQFDGFEKLIADAPQDNVIDMRAGSLDEDILVDASLRISDAPHYGIPSHIHCNPKVKADLVRTFFPKERYDLFGKPSNGMVGLDMRGFTSPAGDCMIEPNVFIDDGGAPLAANGDISKRPAAPAVTAALAIAAADPLSKFAATDAGTYTYSVTAHNDFGRSAPVAVGAIAVVAEDKVSFGLTAGTGNDPVTKWYQIYRSNPDGSDVRLIKKVPNTTGAAELTFEDLNEDLPFTTSAYMWQQNLEALAWKQLAPMIKMPLSTDSPTIRFMMFIYGTPVLYAPGKAILFKNIGRSPAL